MKYLIVEFSDRKQYAIPTEFIADHRAKYYAKKTQNVVSEGTMLFTTKNYFMLWMMIMSYLIGLLIIWIGRA